MTTNGQAPADRLDSWKAIAEYLDRDVATVRRWERSRGLPVRRLPGGRGSSVFAFRSEIDAWLQRMPGSVLPTDVPPLDATPAARRRRWGAAAAGTMAIVVAWWFWPSPVDLANVSVEVVPNGVVAKSAAGEELWRDPAPDGWEIRRSEVGRATQIVTSDPPTVYAAYSHRQQNQSAEGGQLLAFDAQGKRRWEFTFDDQLRLGGKDFSAPWAITDFEVDDSRGLRRTAVAAHHYLWSASPVAILDDTGRRLSTFVHAGWVENVHWLGDRLLVGGFSESRNGGMVALLDPAHANGQGPEEPGSEYFCETCGADAVLRMLAMPRTEVNRLTHSRFNRAVVEVTADRVIARTIEVPSIGQEAVDAIYEFTRGLDLVRASFSARYWEIHDALQAQGRLDHSRSACPDRDGPRQIMEWTPAGKWTTKLIAH